MTRPGRLSYVGPPEPGGCTSGRLLGPPVGRCTRTPFTAPTCPTVGYRRRPEAVPPEAACRPPWVTRETHRSACRRSPGPPSLGTMLAPPTDHQRLREPKIWCSNGLSFQNSFFCFGTVRRTNTYRGSFTKSVLEQLRKPNCFTQAKRSEKTTVLERFLGFFVLEQFGQPTRRRTALQKSGLEQLVYSLVYSFQCSQTVF